MKTALGILFSALFLITGTASADHPVLESGEVYKLPVITVCKKPEPLVTAQEAYEEAGINAALQYLQGKAREGMCGPYRGPAKYTGERLATWKYEGMVFELLEFETPRGTMIYTTRRYRRHGTDA